MYSRTGVIGFACVATAVIPYTVLKVLWLSGSTLGWSRAAALAELQSPRMVIGNWITIALELIAVVLSVALISQWGRRVPAWIIVCLATGAAGLLAPILLGVPLGSAIQLATSADLRTESMDDTAGWVFAMTYASFGLLAVGMAVLASRYALIRWGAVLSTAPRRPAMWAVAVGGIGILPFAAAMIWWGMVGTGTAGPQGMDTLAQRTTLVVTGALCLAGWAVPLLHSTQRWAHTAWFIIWVGCATAALQGPAQLLLASDGRPAPAVAVLTAFASPASCVYGWSVLRQWIAPSGQVGVDSPDSSTNNDAAATAAEIHPDLNVKE